MPYIDVDLGSDRRYRAYMDDHREQGPYNLWVSDDEWAYIEKVQNCAREAYSLYEEQRDKENNVLSSLYFMKGHKEPRLFSIIRD